MYTRHRACTSPHQKWQRHVGVQGDAIDGEKNLEIPSELCTRPNSIIATHEHARECIVCASAPPTLKLRPRHRERLRRERRKIWLFIGLNIENVQKYVWNHSEIWMRSKTKTAPKARTRECLFFVRVPSKADRRSRERRRRERRKIEIFRYIRAHLML